MFTKVSLMSFIYDVIEIFPFPNKIVKEIYSKNKILRFFRYHNLRDTDSTSLMFVFICEVESDLKKR